MYFTIEGCEYSGKTSVMNELKKLYPDYCYVKNPGYDNIEFCRNIRQMVMHSGFNMCKGAELLCYIADRAELIDKVVNAHDIVIGDREFISTLVYQSVRGNFSIDDMINIHKIAYNPPEQICFVLQVNLDELKLRESQNKNKDDIESSIVLTDVYNQYNNIINNNDAMIRMNCTIVKIDANNRSSNEIAIEINNFITNFMEMR